MSTVSNPYTFNIKSNCRFWINALLSNNQVKITMKYSSEDYEEDVPYDHDPDQYYTIYYTVNILEYDSSKNTGNIVPSVVNGNNIDRVRCTLTYGDNNGSDCLIFIKTSQQYSKIIFKWWPI